MFKTIFTSVLASIFVIGILGSVTGCNTIQGAGKDIERGGEKIQDKAEEHK